MSSQLLTRPGAVPAEGADTGVAAHYGDPVAEQRGLAGGTGVSDLSHWGVVAVTGPDRLSWLHSLTSQDVAGLRPGESTQTLFLDPHGHILHAVGIVDDGDTSWLITEAGDAAAVAEFLTSMRFMLQVDVRVADEVVALGALTTGAALLPAAAITWHDPWPTLHTGSTSYSAVENHPGAGSATVIALLPRTDLAAAVDAALAAGAVLAGSLAWEAVRIAGWRPRQATEVDDKSLPHELDWLRTAVHLSKGCYRGQETVARVFNLGKPPRRLVFVHLDGSDHVLPEPGPMLAGDREVGRLTSVARHHELGPIGLAVVKRSLDPAAALTVAGVAAAQEPIVTPEGVGTGRPARARL